MSKPRSSAEPEIAPATHTTTAEPEKNNQSIQPASIHEKLMILSPSFENRE